jgi:hypothetical protein
MERRVKEYVFLHHEVDEHYQDVHPKKQLRINAWNEMREGDHKSLNSTCRLWLHKVLYKMKKDEVAKPGKYPRMIGDLGVAASLQGFRVTGLLKKAMASEAFVYRDGTFEFVATPEPSVLKEVFARLLNPPTKYYFVFFSDDACLSISHQGRVFVFNLDIKWCDASHGPSIFDALIHITPRHMKEDMQVLVDQCKLPIEVRDVTGNKQSVKLTPVNPRLYSGSTITTFINNLANILIFKSIVDAGATDALGVITSAAAVGYGVTLDACEFPEDIQFLKHSPVLDTHGRMQAMLNLGVMFRSIGMCKGDLPGRGPIRPRADEFVAQFLQGMYPRTNFGIKDGLLLNLTRAPWLEEIMQKKFCADFPYIHKDDSGETYEADPRSIARRYRLTEGQFDEMTVYMSAARHQTWVASSSIEAVLRKDYGLGVQFTTSFD